MSLPPPKKKKNLGKPAPFPPSPLAPAAPRRMRPPGHRGAREGGRRRGGDSGEWRSPFWTVFGERGPPGRRLLTCFTLGSGCVERRARIHEVTDGEQPAAPVTGVENSILEGGGGRRGAGTELSPGAAPDPRHGPPLLPQGPAGDGGRGGHALGPAPPWVRAQRGVLVAPGGGRAATTAGWASHGRSAGGLVPGEDVVGPRSLLGIPCPCAWQGKRGGAGGSWGTWGGAWGLCVHGGCVHGVCVHGVAHAWGLHILGGLGAHSRAGSTPVCLHHGGGPRVHLPTGWGLLGGVCAPAGSARSCPPFASSTQQAQLGEHLHAHPRAAGAVQAPAKAPAWIRPCHGWSPTPLPYRGARTHPSPFFFLPVAGITKRQSRIGPVAWIASPAWPHHRPVPSTVP